MALRWAWVRRGTSMPLSVAVTSSAALAAGVAVPTPTLPPEYWIAPLPAVLQ